MGKMSAIKMVRGKAKWHPPRKRRLKSLDDLRRFLADVLNRLEAGELNDAAAKTRAYVVNILAAVVKDTDVEARVARLEVETEARLDLKKLTPEEMEAIRSITEKLVVDGG